MTRRQKSRVTTPKFAKLPAHALVPRRLWSQIPGFADWMRATGPTLTNAELRATLAEKFGQDVSSAAIDSLRRVYRSPMSPETRRRAYDSRRTSFVVAPGPKPEASPVSKEEQMDRSLLRREVRRLGARQTFYELVGQQIIDAVRELPPFVTPKPPKPLPLKGQSEEEAVLLISDVQAGMVVDVRESGGLGRYTSEILVDQINTLRDTVLSICARYHPNVRRLNIFFLGDIIEGQAIFPGQLRSIDMHAVQQVLFCWERFAEFQAALARHFQEVRCWGTCGNHGRVSGRPGEFSPLSNFDYLLYMMWQQRLSSVKNIKWTVAQSWWDIADVCGFRFLLVHGDDTVGWAGVPFYGLLRHKARYRELFTTLRREHGDFDYLTVGHHSVLAQFNGIYMNGSWPGGTEFSLKRLQLGDVPGQKLMGVHPRWGVSWTRDLLLRPLPPRAPEQESR